MVSFKLQTAIKKRQKEFIFSTPKSSRTELERTLTYFFPILIAVIKEEFSVLSKGIALRTQLRFKIKLKKFLLLQSKNAPSCNNGI